MELGRLKNWFGRRQRPRTRECVSFSPYAFTQFFKMPLVNSLRCLVQHIYNCFLTARMIVRRSTLSTITTIALEHWVIRVCMRLQFCVA